MKKLTKKNNKGFSLVELIVVVLIMAIIAVALAPQVTKWVQNSRISSDAQNFDSVVSAIQIAGAQGDLTKAGEIVTTKGSAWAASSGSNADTSELEAVLGEGWESKLQSKVDTYKITYTTNGTITSMVKPNASSVSND